MKMLLTLYCCILCVTSFAQSEASGKVNRDSIPQQIDSIQIYAERGRNGVPNNNEIVFWQLGAISKKDNAIGIPTVKPDTKIIQATPIKKLSGKGLAPMPGTDSLDHQKNVFDSVYIPKIIIKTTPPPIK